VQESRVKEKAMDKQKLVTWLKTTGLAVVGGGIAAVVTTLSEPEYHFPQELVSGKLFIHFLGGAAVTFAALLLKSPLGQQTMAAYKDSQAQLAQSKADLAAAKEALKSPPSGPPAQAAATAPGAPPPSSPPARK
jgi:hypothetical protein